MNILELDEILTLRNLTPEENVAVIALMKIAAEEAVEEYKAAQHRVNADQPIGSDCPHGFVKRFDCPECNQR